MKTWDVVLCLKITLTVRVDASSESDAEDFAHDAATDAVVGMHGGRPVGVSAHEDDRAIHRITEVKSGEAA